MKIDPGLSVPRTRPRSPEGSSHESGEASTALVQTTAETGLDVPLEGYHVHLNAMAIDQAVEMSKQMGVK